MVDKEAQQAIDRIFSRDDQEKKTFLDRLGKDYPEPQADAEGNAFVWLRQWWSPKQIQRFIDAYNADAMVYPGIINTSKGPGLEMFVNSVGLLAFGAYARGLPKLEMLKIVAGRTAAHGAKFKPAAKRRDLLARAIVDALNALPKSERNSNLAVFNLVVASNLDGFIQEIHEDERQIDWITPKGKENSTSWKRFQNRCTKLRKEI